MKSLPIARRISFRRNAFTLVELLVAASLMGIVGLISFGVLRSGTLLSKQNTGINVSASRARTALDEIGERARYSLEQPSLMTAAGAGATGTADGLALKRFRGGPYVVKDSVGGTADISEAAKQFVLEYRPDLPAPEVSDWILIESVSRPQLEIASVSTPSLTNGVQRCTITTVAALGELVKPSAYRIGASLFRKEAYVFAPQSGTADERFELRHFGRVKANTDFALAANFTVTARGYRRLAAQPFFAAGISNGAALVTLRAMVNSPNGGEIMRGRQSDVSSFTTVPIQLRLWSLNR